jgi:hypothetical protein
MGEHEDYVRDFVRKNRELLERVPSAFFSVSLTAREHTERPGRRPKGTSRSSWRKTDGTPTGSASSRARSCTGSMDSSQRHLMRRISKQMGNQDTDTSRDYEYTDWTTSGTSPRSSWRTLAELSRGLGHGEGKLSSVKERAERARSTRGGPSRREAREEGHSEER